MKFSFPMPRDYPESFEGISKELIDISEKITLYRERKKELGEFFNEWEELYFKALGTSGDAQRIRFVTLYLIWCQMMAILREELN